MKVTLESTSRIIQVCIPMPEELSRAVNAASLDLPSTSLEDLKRAINHALVVPARIWEGKTVPSEPEGLAINCFAAITRIAHHKRDDAFAKQFELDLQSVRTPSSDALKVFETRLVL